MLARLWIFFGALNGLSAVALAAVATHAGLPALQSGVEIQGWHAAALLFCGVRRGRLVDVAGTAFVVGTVLFCAGVYAVAFFGAHLGVTAPTGGVILMLGWIVLGASSLLS